LIWSKDTICSKSENGMQINDKSTTTINKTFNVIDKHESQEVQHIDYESSLPKKPSVRRKPRCEYEMTPSK